jgi:hypothetical protein
MNKLVLALAGAIASLMLAPSAASAQAQCTNLVSRYRAEIDTASRFGALNQAMGDNISPGQRTANESRESNALTRARMAREALRAAGCRTPTLVPNPEPYLSSARRCLVDTIMTRYDGRASDYCNPERWQSRP